MKGNITFIALHRGNHGEISKIDRKQSHVNSRAFYGHVSLSTMIFVFRVMRTLVYSSILGMSMYIFII